MLLTFDHRGDFSLHAAAVQVGSGAVILAAPSRFGKTTLALRLPPDGPSDPERGSRLLPARVAGSAARTSARAAQAGRLRRHPPDRDAGGGRQTGPGLPGPGGPFRGSSAPLPILGIVFLREGDALRMEPAPVVDSIRDLWHLGFRLPTAEARAESFRALGELAGGVPVWNLFRPLRLEYLDQTVELIVGHVAR